MKFLIRRLIAAFIFMADISACSGVLDKKDKSEATRKCKLRYECKRYSTHLASVSKQQSYIKAQFQDNGTCEMMKAI